MEKYKTVIQKNKFKISVPIWNKEFNLPDGTYSLSDIKDYFDHIIKKHETITGNLSIIIYVNKIGNRTTFTIKAGYYLELLTPGTMILLGSSKIKINKDENGENMPHLEIIKWY